MAIYAVETLQGPFECHCAAGMQVRVVQGKEPAQFVGIWNGTMVVYEGGVASGFKSFKEEDSDGSSDGSSKLFQVRSHHTQQFQVNILLVGQGLVVTLT